MMNQWKQAQPSIPIYLNKKIKKIFRENKKRKTSSQKSLRKMNRPRVQTEAILQELLLLNQLVAFKILINSSVKELHQYHSNSLNQPWLVSRAALQAKDTRHTMISQMVGGNVELAPTITSKEGSNVTDARRLRQRTIQRANLNTCSWQLKIRKSSNCKNNTKRKRLVSLLKCKL